MAAYHQMGHHSENLLRDQNLGMFQGAILSPVNYTQDGTSAQIAQMRDIVGFRTVFDPQLYVPNSERGQLRKWSYFPTDVDTADLGSSAWWDELVQKVAKTAQELEPTAVCSPATLYRTYSVGYFSEMVDVGRSLSRSLDGTGIECLQTIVVGLADLTSQSHRMEIGSVVTRSEVGSVFLVLVGSTEPRRELTDVEELKGALDFIAMLERSGVRVTVGYTSSDMLLWKAAGATNCATGKFFNLRRFTRTRFEEPTGGGGQLPYWFEQSLVAFLRESDLLRVRTEGLISDASSSNPCSDQIFAKVDAGEAWLALAWRHYMYWFGYTEERVTSGQLDVDALLSAAEEAWERLRTRRVLMEEVANDGRWLRPWRRALAEHTR